MKKRRLLWIRSLMLLSMAMLIGLLSSWLVAQYGSQKEQLTKDLNIALSDAHETLMDSIVHAIAIDSALADPVVAIEQANNRRVSKLRNKARATMIIRTDEIDSKRHKQFEYTISKPGHTKPDTIFFNDNDSKGFTQTTIRYDSDDSIVTVDHSRVVEPMLKVIFKSLASSGNFSDEFKLEGDSLKLKNAFSKELTKHNWNFPVYWSKEAQKGKQNLILLNNQYFTKVLPVAIGDYNLYLLKKLTPQLLFSIFLLLVTAAAFLFTYNTLREQIRLGVIRNEFISNMSHELKTPVSTVKVALEAINNFQPITDTATIRDYLRMATLETERLEMLINQSLNVSLMEQGRMTLHKEPYNLEHLLNKTLQAMQVRFKQANAKVQVHTDTPGAIAEMDVLHIQGVIINLLDNSLKYSNTLPVIDVTLSEDEQNIVLSVADNGPGIPAEYKDKIFEKFFRVPFGDRHNVKGYGLGLSYVKEAITQHNGTIAVTNTDNGCVFTIKLPKARA